MVDVRSTCAGVMTQQSDCCLPAEVMSVQLSCQSRWSWVKLWACMQMGLCNMTLTPASPARSLSAATVCWRPTGVAVQLGVQLNS